jgi:hypothetical protein
LNPEDKSFVPKILDMAYRGRGSIGRPDFGSSQKKSPARKPDSSPAHAATGLAVVVVMVVVTVERRRIRRDSGSGKNGDTQKGKHPDAKLHGDSPRFPAPALCTGIGSLLNTYNPVPRRTFQQVELSLSAVAC